MCPHILSRYDECFTLEPCTSVPRICDLITDQNETVQGGWQPPGGRRKRIQFQGFAYVAYLRGHRVGFRNPGYVREAEPSFALPEQNFAPRYVW